MLFILMRHTQAVPVGDEGVTDDFHRHLTGRGVVQAATVAGHLAELGVKLDAVLASPLTRAQHTAESLAALLPAGASVTVANEFASGNVDFAAMAEAVSAANGEAVMAVGHMPDVAGFARWLLGQGIGGFDVGQAVAIRFPNGPAERQGRVEWTFAPGG